MLSEIRNKFKFLEDFLGNVFVKLRMSPNQFTLLSVVFALVSFYFLVNFKFLPSFILFLSAGLMDLIDGAMARKTNAVSKKGAYLDTICDRYVSGILLLGFLFLPLETVVLPPQVWIGLSFLGGMMTTYAKAAAKEKELMTDKPAPALFGRPERVISIALAILLGIFDVSLIICPIIVLAVFSNISAIQRIYIAFSSASN